MHRISHIFSLLLLQFIKSAASENGSVPTYVYRLNHCINVTVQHVERMSSSVKTPVAVSADGWSATVKMNVEMVLMNNVAVSFVFY